MGYDTTKANVYRAGDGGLSLLDCVNLAHCASQRAHMSAGDNDCRFYREYKSALSWSVAASTYDMKYYYRMN